VSLRQQIYIETITICQAHVRTYNLRNVKLLYANFYDLKLIWQTTIN